MEKIIPLPIPKHAYDPGRRMSTLLRSQVELLQQAVVGAIDSKEEMASTITVLTDLLQQLRPKITEVRKLQSAVSDAIDTEAEAALCIGTLTGLLRELRPQIEPRAHSASARKKKGRKKRAKSRRNSTSVSLRSAGAKK